MFCLGITVYTPTIVCHKISIFILFYNLLEINWILELSFQAEILLLINLIIEPESNYMKISVINMCIMWYTTKCIFMLRENQHHNVIKNIQNKNVKQKLWITIAKVINAMENLFAAVKESSYQTSKSLCSTQSALGKC